MMALDALIRGFNGRVAFRERRPGVLQVLAPLFHEDGDMVDIFLDEPVNGSGKVRIGDHGLTLMRLTYTYDLDREQAAHLQPHLVGKPDSGTGRAVVYRGGTRPAVPGAASVRADGRQGLQHAVLQAGGHPESFL